MEEDLNTASATGLIFEKVREVNKVLDSGEGSPPEPVLQSLSRDRRNLLMAGRVLGLFEESPARFFEEIAVRPAGDQVDPSVIEKMIQERAAARKEKNWARADEIRDQLKKMGVILEDGPQGTTWRSDV
ncbi:MAG: cysteine--tRNA ligase, partial [Deltaproteobacteria bacterium]